ncbi:sensor histidine kinase [Dyadobacter sp. 32]|uniref:ligand-binding sensor domain-containing protein n=1 Tax=Dyadobacter sp. 32 TaxID=538966 RepID=UPI0011ED5B96
MNKNPKINYFVTAILFAMTLANAWGQQNFRFRHVGVEDGLSQGSIYSMHKDSRGFLWLGTEDGINRFDGDNIQVYLSGSTGESTNVLGIAEDNLADLWIGSHRGVFYYPRKQNKFTRQPYLSPLANVSVHVFADSRKNIYFLSEIGLFLKKNNSIELITKEFTYKRTQFNNFLAETPDGDLWLVDADSGLLRYHTAAKKVTSYFSARKHNIYGAETKFNCIGMDKTGNMWLASKTALMKFDYLKNSVETYPHSGLNQHIPTDIEADLNGLLWMATEGSGIFVFDPAKKKWIQHLKHEDDITNSLKFNEIGMLHIDENNDIFVNTDPQGLDIITAIPSAFSFYTYGKNQEKNLSDYSVRGIAEDADSSIWIGTELGGINNLNLKTGKVTHYTTKDGLSGNTIRVILKDPKNKLWVASVNGLSTFIPEQQRFRPVALPTVAEITNMLAIDRDRLLLSTNKGLIILRTSDNYVESYSHQDLIAGYGTYWDEKAGTAYVSNRYRGVNLFTIKADGPPARISKFLEHFHVLQIYRQPHTPFIWACTDTGLVKWNMVEKKLVKNFRIADGLHHEYIYCLLPDSYGHFWLSTNRGITKFDPGTERFEFVKEIPPREYNSRSAMASGNGTLYFGSTSGMDVITPKMQTIQNNHVGIQLTDFTYDQMPETDSLYIGERTRLQLPYSSNSFTLKFTATDFRSGGINRFRYLLKGYDKDTIYAGNTDQVRYARLPAGSYEFLLQASDLGGNWVSPVRKLMIVILPPFWQTWWFIATAILLAAGFIYTLVKAYLHSRLTAQRLESERQIFLEKERSRIARDMNDSLGSELFGLKLLGQVALSQNQTEGAENYLHKIVSISKSISEKISEVIWLTDANQDNVESLWSYILKNALIYLKPSGIHYYFEALPVKNNFLISGERRHEILNFCKQLFFELTNLQATEEIEVQFKIAGDHLLTSVKNTDLTQLDPSLLGNLTKLKGSKSLKNGSTDIQIPLRN